jgi:hypothetical protein
MSSFVYTLVADAFDAKDDNISIWLTDYILVLSSVLNDKSKAS